MHNSKLHPKWIYRIKYLNFRRKKKLILIHAGREWDGQSMILKLCLLAAGFNEINENIIIYICSFWSVGLNAHWFCVVVISHFIDCVWMCMMCDSGDSLNFTSFCVQLHFNFYYHEYIDWVTTKCMVSFYTFRLFKRLFFDFMGILWIFMISFLTRF